MAFSTPEHSSHKALALNRHDHYIPAVRLVIYPLTLIIGSIFSLISPTANPATSNITSTTAAIDHTSTPVNYFARKDNIFNIYFVKIGWIWTTAAFLSILLTQPGFVGQRIDADHRLRRVWQSILRYTLVTLAWILTTQWCFGPAIIDRGFIATGGRCERILAGGMKEPISESIMTAVACRMVKGTWHGGHDVSGHSFMLVLASAFLVFELYGSKFPSNQKPEPKSKDDGGQISGIIQGDNVQDPAARMSQHFVVIVAALCWWMLLMTGIWFHTFLEKASGLIIALAAVYGIYVVPRTSPSWRNVIGTPGQ